MRIYEDTTSGAAWHYCFGCKRAGDMVDLAAAVWQMGHQATIKKLSALGIPLPLELIDKYLATRERRNQLSGLWERAKDNLATTRSQALHGLRHRIGLNVSCGPERWRAGPGMLLGGMHFKEVHTYLIPNSLNAAGFGGRLFKGPQWGDTLITPYYSHHDKIVGYAFCGRKGTDKGDRVWYFSNVGARRAEAGLAGMWTVEAAHAMFAQFYVAMSDPWFMLRIQLRHFAASAIPLPLVTWHDDGVHVTNKTWQFLTGRVPVFWVTDEVLTAQIMHQAIISDGHISFAKMETFNSKTAGHYVRNNEPREVIRKVIKRAKPWRQALVDWANDAMPGPVEELLLHLKDYGHDTKALAELSPKLGAVVITPVQDREAKMPGGGKVIEKDGRWWHRTTKGSELMMDGILRIDGSSLKELRGREVAHYTGRLLFDGKELPFELPITTLTHYGADRLRELSLRLTGKMIYIAPRYRTTILTVATAFSSMP